MQNKRIQTVLLFISCLSVMSAAVVAPAIPGIAREFSSQPEASLLARIVLTLPALFIALASPVAGKLADTVSRKAMLLCSLIIYLFSGLAVFWLRDIWMIFAFRATTGISIAGIMTVTTALLVDNSSKEKREKVLGYQSAMMAFSAVVFSFTGGFLAEVGWRFTFLSFSLAALAILALFLTSFDNTHHYKSRGASNPEKRKYVNGLQVLILTVCFILMAIFYLLPTRVPFLIQATLGKEAFWVGLAMALLNLTTAASSLLYDKVKKSLSFRAVFAAMLILMSWGYLIIGGADSLVNVCFGIMIAGFGLGLLYPNVSAWLTEEDGGKNTGRIMGKMTSAIFLGHFLSPLMFHHLFANGRFQLGMQLTSAFLLVSSLGFILWKSNTKKTSAS